MASDESITPAVGRRGRVVVAIVVSVLLLSGVTYWGAHLKRNVARMLERENQLQAMLVVGRALDECIMTTGHWPGSWDDLIANSERHADNMWRWPEDASELKGRVYINFEASLDELSRSDKSSFDAFRPAREVNDIYKLLVISPLLQVIHECTNKYELSSDL